MEQDELLNCCYDSDSENPTQEVGQHVLREYRCKSGFGHTWLDRRKMCINDCHMNDRNRRVWLKWGIWEFRDTRRDVDKRKHHLFKEQKNI